MDLQTAAYFVSPVVTLVFANRHVDVRISDVIKIIQAETGRLEALIRAEVAEVRLDLAKLDHRIERLEEQRLIP